MDLGIPGIGLIVALAAATLAHAADRLQSSAAEAADPVGASPGPSIQSGAGLAACLAWTDGCINCLRQGGTIACSNTGIACQPQTPRCLDAMPTGEPPKAPLPPPK